MRSILEKAFVALLNEEHDKAEELFHKFMVERARQIHESIRAGEEFVLEENWDDEITTESYFTEEDLTDLEDGAEEGAEGEEGAADDLAGDLGAEGDEDFGGDDAGEEEVPAEFGAEGDDDFGGEEAGEEETVETKIDDLADQIEKLTAEFEAMMDAIGGDEDADGEDMDAGADDFGGEDGGDEFDAEGDIGGEDAELAGDMQDDMGDEGEEEHVEESADDEEDFDDISESIIDELEKVQVSLTDGTEIAAGKSFTQNKTSPAPQKSKDARQGGEPVKIKSSKHSGFARETAPGVETLKPRRNNVSKANAALSSVSKEGDKSAEINKLSSEENTKSIIPGGKPGFKK